MRVAGFNFKLILLVHMFGSVFLLLMFVAFRFVFVELLFVVRAILVLFVLRSELCSAISVSDEQWQSAVTHCTKF